MTPYPCKILRPAALGLLAFGLAIATLTATAADLYAPHSLASLLGQTLSSHPALAARQAGVNAATAEVEAARWQFFPTPALALEQAGRPALVGADREVLVASLKQPLWQGGRLEAGLTQAQAGLVAAGAQREEGRRELALEVIQAYGDAFASQARMRAWQTSVTVHDRLLGLVQRRAAEGLSTQSDVGLAESRRAGVDAERELARAQFNSARQKLQSLSNQPLQGALSSPGHPHHLAATAIDVQSTLQAALANDPTLSRLQAEAQQLQAEVTKTRAALWPSLYARLEQRHGDVNGKVSRLMVGLESQWGAGLTNASASVAASQRQVGKQADIEARRRRLAEQIESDINLLHSLQARVQALTIAQAGAQDVSASWDRQFLAGKKSWQDVMNAVREDTQIQAQLADAQGSASVTAWRLTVYTQDTGLLAQVNAPVKSP